MSRTLLSSVQKSLCSINTFIIIAWEHTKRFRLFAAKIWYSTLPIKIKPFCHSLDLLIILIWSMVWWCTNWQYDKSSINTFFKQCNTLINLHKLCCSLIESSIIFHLVLSRSSITVNYRRHFFVITVAPAALLKILEIPRQFHQINY
jgi:hypothetical protein